VLRRSFVWRQKCAEADNRELHNFLEPRRHSRPQNGAGWMREEECCVSSCFRAVLDDAIDMRGGDIAELSQQPDLPAEWIRNASPSSRSYSEQIEAALSTELGVTGLKLYHARYKQYSKGQQDEDLGALSWPPCIRSIYLFVCAHD